MESDYFYDIAQQIENYLGSLLGVRVYAAILDGNGEIKFAREDFNENDMITYITSFVLTNFNMLEIGDHSFPISGKNLAFFKLSEKSMIVLLTKKGKLGSLLAFKNKMFKFAPQIDEQIGDFTQITVNKKTEIANGIAVSKDSTSPAQRQPQYQKVTQKKFAKLPVLTKELTGKEKFPINDVRVLRLCDGKHTLSKIVKEASIPRLEVQNVIKKYQKKKYLKLKRTQI